MILRDPLLLKRIQQNVSLANKVKRLSAKRRLINLSYADL